MRKVMLMSVILAPLILAMRFSADPNAGRGLRRTIVWTFAFTVLWALVTPWILPSE